MTSVDRSSLSPETVRLEVSGAGSEVKALHLKVTGGETGETILLVPVSETARINRKREEAFFATPALRPILSIRPVLRRADGTLEEITTGPNYNLDNLLPTEKSDLSRLVFHKSSRVSDEPTLRFMLEQVFESGANNYFERIEAAKILAYRVLEGVHLPEIGIALGRLDRALDWVPHLPDEFGIAKTSRYQSRISLLYIRYLLHLFNDDGPAVRRELELIAQSTGSVAECPIAAYNLCLALLAAGLIQAETGLEAEAKASWLEVIRLFRVAAANMPSKNPSTFVELTVSFEAAKQAAWAIETQRSRRPTPSTLLDADRVASAFSRLRNPQAIAFMASRLRSIVGQLAPHLARPVTENA